MAGLLSGRAMFRAMACILLLSFVTLSGVAAERDAAVFGPPPASNTLKAGIYVSPPFVMKEGSGFSGMAIELWDMVATDLDLKTQYVEYDTFRDLVSATEHGEVDVAVTNLTITKDRARRIDFTHPWFDAGLRIMVGEEQGAGFWRVLGGLQASGHLKAYAWIIAIILLATVVLTFFDRHFDTNFPRRWREGIAESFYTVMSVATSGKPPSRKNLFGWMGRIWQGLWLVCGVAVLAYVTSSVTSVMTTLSLTSQINSAADLPGHPVGVFTGSVAEQYARDSGLHVRSYPHIEDAVQALENGRILAIVGDAPVLEYYVHTNPGVPLRVVGPIFDPDKYGFGLPPNSQLTRPLSIELIGAHESEAIEEIRKRYFGDKS